MTRIKIPKINFRILLNLGFTDTATAINCAEDTLMGEGDE